MITQITNLPVSQVESVSPEPSERDTEKQCRTPSVSSGPIAPDVLQKTPSPKTKDMALGCTVGSVSLHRISSGIAVTHVGARVFVTGRLVAVTAYHGLFKMAWTLQNLKKKTWLMNDTCWNNRIKWSIYEITTAGDGTRTNARLSY